MAKAAFSIHKTGYCVIPPPKLRLNPRHKSMTNGRLRRDLSLYKIWLEWKGFFCSTLSLMNQSMQVSIILRTTEVRLIIVLYAYMTGLSCLRHKHGSFNLPTLWYMAQSQGRPENITEGQSIAWSSLVGAPGRLYSPQVTYKVPDCLLII